MESLSRELALASALELGVIWYLSEERRYLPPQTRKSLLFVWLVLVLPPFFVLRISFSDFVTPAARLVQPPVMAA